MFDDAVRRKELKERIQLLSAKRELEELRQQPEICKKSQKMVAQSRTKAKEGEADNKGHVPIHERYDKVLQQTQNKIDKFNQQILEEKIK